VSQLGTEATTIRSLSPAPCCYITETPYNEYKATLQKNLKFYYIIIYYINCEAKVIMIPNDNQSE